MDDELKYIFKESLPGNKIMVQGYRFDCDPIADFIGVPDYDYGTIKLYPKRRINRYYNGDLSPRTVPLYKIKNFWK